MTICLLLEKPPLELREAIYQECLRADEDTVIDKNGIQHQPTGLISTCRQIRIEARKIFYETNTFRILISETSLLTAVKWLSSLPPSDRAHLKHVILHFKYAGFEGSMSSWSNTLDELVAGGQDPMSAFSHLPGYLYHKRHRALEDMLKELKHMLASEAVVNVEIEEFDGDMFPHIWKQCWLDCLEDMGGRMVGEVRVVKVSGKETRPPGFDENREHEAAAAVD